MNTIGTSVAAGMMLAATQASADIKLPAHVETCYNEAYSALMEGGSLTKSTVAQYVSVDGVRQAYGNQGMGNASDAEIINSAFSFAIDVRERIEKSLKDQENSEKAIERTYTKYVEYSTRRMIKGKIGEYRIVANLDPSECKFVNAVIAGVKGMLDDVNRDNSGND